MGRPSLGSRGDTEWTATSIWQSPGGEVWATTAAQWNDHASPLGTIIRRDGERWREVWTTPQPLLQIAGHGDRVWAAGLDGALVSCKGDRCEPVASRTDDDFIALWAMNGELWAGGQHGTLLAWNGLTWLRRAPGSPDRRLRAIWGRSRIDLFAAEQNGLLHGDGIRWIGDMDPCEAGTSADGKSFTAIAGRSADDVWATGYCTEAKKGSVSDKHFGQICPSPEGHGQATDAREFGVYHHEAQGWRRVAEGAFCSLLVTPTQIAAGGYGGHLLIGSRPDNLRRVETGTTAAIRHIAAGDDGRIWIVGGEGAVPRLVDPRAGQARPRR